MTSQTADDRRRRLEQLGLPPPPTDNQLIGVVEGFGGLLHAGSTCISPDVERQMMPKHQAAPLVCQKCLVPTHTTISHSDHQHLAHHARIAQQWLHLTGQINALQDDVAGSQPTALPALTRRYSQVLNTLRDTRRAPQQTSDSSHDSYLLQLQQHCSSATRNLHPAVHNIRRHLQQLVNPQQHRQALVASLMLLDDDASQEARDHRQQDLQLLAEHQVCDPHETENIRTALLLTFHTTLHKTTQDDDHTAAFHQTLQEPNVANTILGSPDNHTTAIRQLARRWLDHTNNTVATANRQTPRLVHTTNPPDAARILLHIPTRQMTADQLIAVVHPTEANWAHPTLALDCGPAPHNLLQLTTKDQRQVLATAAATYQPDDAPDTVMLPRHVQAITNNHIEYTRSQTPPAAPQHQDVCGND